MSGITVNGTVISEQAIDREVQYHPAPALDTARAEAARALVVRELLLQEAERCGVAAIEDPEEGAAGDEEGRLHRLLEREVPVPEPDAASCRRYYENNRRRFRSAELFAPSHILFSVASDDEAAYAAAVARAEETIAALQAQPARFAALARELSDCPSAAQGGSLGQVTRGQTTPEFETFLLNLAEGQLCPVPVRTRYGVHVLRLDARVEGRALPYELVADRIAEYLRTASWQRAVHHYITVLAARAELRGIDLGVTDSPLLQ